MLFVKERVLNEKDVFVVKKLIFKIRLLWFVVGTYSTFMYMRVSKRVERGSDIFDSG